MLENILYNCSLNYLSYWFYPGKYFQNSSEITKCSEIMKTINLSQQNIKKMKLRKKFVPLVEKRPKIVDSLQ